MKLLLASQIHPEAVAALREHHDVECAFGASEDVLQERIADREVLVFRSGVQITAAVMGACPNLKLILRAGSGMDNIDMEYVRQHDIPFVRVPGPAAQAVAELAFCMMLALSRRLMEFDRGLRDGQWLKGKLTAHLMSKRVLGVVGAGNIGSRVAQMGVAWGMDVVGCVEHHTPEREAEFAQMGVRLLPLPDVLAVADYVSVHVPLNPSTRNLIGEREFGRMKTGAFLVNLARGGVVDERALREALESERLSGAGLDVHEQEGAEFASPVADMRNVVLTPHVGSATYESQLEIGQIVMDQIDEFVKASEDRR